MIEQYEELCVKIEILEKEVDSLRNKYWKPLLEAYMTYVGISPEQVVELTFEFNPNAYDEPHGVLGFCLSTPEHKYKREAISVAFHSPQEAPVVHFFERLLNGKEHIPLKRYRTVLFE